MSGLKDFRERGEKMLKRWGKEVAEGSGKPNILAMMDHIPGDGDGFYQSAGPSFSPLAEIADKLLADVRRMDKQVTEYLLAFALNLSLSDMERAFDGSRSSQNVRLERALATWAILVYFRAKLHKPDPAKKSA